MASPDRLCEAIRLRLPGDAARHEFQGVAEVAVRSGVLVEAAGQVGQGVAEVLAGHDRGVQEDPGGTFGDGGGLVVRHAGQHFDVYFDAESLGQHEGEGHVEKVVRGHPDLDRPLPGGLEQANQQSFVGGVGLRFRLISGLRPTGQFSGRLFHGQVGPFDQTHAYRRSSRLGPLLGKTYEPFERLVTVREVRLQSDAGTEVGELRSSQAPGKRLHRQVEVPVLLHVQVDELLITRGGYRPVQLLEALAYPVN